MLSSVSVLSSCACDMIIPVRLTINKSIIFTCLQFYNNCKLALFRIFNLTNLYKNKSLFQLLISSVIHMSVSCLSLMLS